MKKAAGFLLIALLASSVIAVSCSFTSASDVKSYTVEQAALHCAKFYFRWTNVSISHTKSLYDFNGRLIAYSVDIKNNTTNRIGYEIISVISTDDLVYEYSMDSASPYDKISAKDKCLYDGPDSYYAKVSKKNKYYDAEKKTILSKSMTISLMSEAKNHTYKSKNLVSANEIKEKANFSSATALADSFTLIKKVTTSSGTKKSLHYNFTKVLRGIPDYCFYGGCSPTAAAMALKYIFPRKTPSDEYQLINTVARYMQTADSGATHSFNIPKGIIKAMAYYGVRNIIAYNETPKKSTFAAFKKTIDSGLPLLVNVTKSSTYDNHSMCGIGYDTLFGNFIIVHDTNGNGNVYINMNSSVMGTSHMWTFISKPTMF